MIKNYFKTAIQHLRRNRVYAVINTTGLSIGIAAFLLIFIVINFQSSFDNFHPEKKTIYRVGSEFQTDDGINYSSAVGFPVANGLRLDYPDLKQVAAIYKDGGQLTIDPKGGTPEKLLELNFYYAEPSFFKMFHFPFLKGNLNSSFSNPNDAVLTETAAKKYFGSVENAMGKTFTFANKNLYTVTGILKDIPQNSDFPLSVVVPYSALQQTNSKKLFEDWISTIGGVETYIVLPPHVGIAQMNQRLHEFSRRHKPEGYWSDSYVVQPLSEIHFDERFGNFSRKTFSHTLINTLSLIGIFLLIIACVNFINLATAQAVNRSKEVGVRKVLGSDRKQLIFQFMMEIAMIVFAACVLAIVIAYITLPFLNQLLEVQMTFDLLNPLMLLFLVSVFLITTLLSGIYPAIILSGFNPIKALKNRTRVRTGKGLSFRRGLVIFQFVIAQVLIIAMLIVVRQLHFFRNASLGFNKASIVNVWIPNDTVSLAKTDYLKNSLLSNPNILSVSFSFAPPSSPSNWSSDFRYNHALKSTNFIANLKWADPEYFKTFGLKLLAGRAYYPSDTVREMVVNEMLLKKLGILHPEEAIGKEIDLWNGGLKGEIVGVVRDFNVNSLREPMIPVIMSTYKSTYRTANIKIKPDKVQDVIPFLSTLWNRVYPNDIFNYKFFDNTIDNFYKAEDQLAQLYKIFAAIAIFISCLGLYGLVSFMANQRAKEVGVRKVLGASAMNIVFLLSKEFTLLIGIAFVVSAPVAWFIMKRWLQDYSYRISITPVVFLIAIAGSVVVAWLTVGHRAIQASRANPVKTLRSE